MGTLHAHRRSTAQEVLVAGPASRHAEKPQGPLSAILAADRAGAHLGCFASSIFHHHLVPSFSLFAVSCAHASSTYARSSELEPDLPTGRSRPRALGTLAGELYLLASRCCAPTTIKIVSGRTPPGVLTPSPPSHSVTCIGFKKPQITHVHRQHTCGVATFCIATRYVFSAVLS